MKFFIGRLAITEGNSGACHLDQALFVAKDEAQANSLNESRAMMWGGDDGQVVVGGAWRFHDEKTGTFTVYANGMLEVSAAAFDDLKDWLPVFGDRKSAETQLQEPSDAVKTLARRIGDQLVKHDVKVSHSKLLHAVAASLGHTDWQVLKHAGAAPAAHPAPVATPEKPWYPRGNWPTTKLEDIRSFDFTARVNALWLTHGDVELAAKLLHVEPEALMSSFVDPMEADTAFCGRPVGWNATHSLAPNLGMFAMQGHSNGYRVDHRLSSNNGSMHFVGSQAGTEMFRASGFEEGGNPRFTWNAAALPTGLRDVGLLAECLNQALRHAYEELRVDWTPPKD
jgi:hypothetical protein